MRNVSVELPVGEVVGGHVGRHVACRLSPVQGRALKRLTASLRKSGAELLPKSGQENGRRVENGADAVRWMLERFESGVRSLESGEEELTTERQGNSRKGEVG